MVMQLVVLCRDSQKEELLATEFDSDTQITWINDAEEFLHHKNANAFFDLLFDSDIKRIKILNSLHPKPVFVNDVLQKKTDNSSFIRFNGWPTFLQRKIFEASCDDSEIKNKVAIVLKALNRTIEWVPDTPGFISARVLAMIINEAYFTLGEGVSSKEEIDAAMKLGTNYPYGPFEWSEKIGLQNIYFLLLELNKINDRYSPAPLLKEQALN